MLRNDEHGAARRFTRARDEARDTNRLEVLDLEIVSNVLNRAGHTLMIVSMCTCSGFVMQFAKGAMWLVGCAYRCGICAKKWLMLVVCAAGVSLMPACTSEQVVYDGPGVEVPGDFGCWHDVGYVVNWPRQSGQDLYYGPDAAFRVRANRVRLYGMGGLEWNNTEKSPGVFDWAWWDAAFDKLRATGVRHVTLNLYNPPAFATRHPHNYGGWRMQLPRERVMLERWLDAVTTRYPEIDAIEVANEVFSPTIGDSKSYFTGSAMDLRELSDWVLDWRARRRWTGKVWAPSIPGVGENVEAMLRWLRQYPRAKEFDAFPLHLYHLLPEHVGKRKGRSTSWTALVEFREGLQAQNLGPIVDSEKGFDPGDVREGTLFNYAVAALLQGVRVTCYFALGSYGRDETNLGQPFRNDWAKADIEAVADLAGRRITRVVTTPTGRWHVTAEPLAR